MLPIGYKCIGNRSVTQIYFLVVKSSVAKNLFIAANSTLPQTFVVLDLL